MVIKTPVKNQGFITVKGVLTPIASPKLKASILGKDTAKGERGRPRKTTKAKKPNPASKGASISDILKHRSTLPIRPKGSKKPPKQRPAAGTLKINTSFKVTKSGKAVSTKTKQQDRGREQPSLPMRPISPQAARNNGPNQPTLLFPNLQKPSMSADIIFPNLSTHRVQARKGSDTISPTGRLPPSLAMIMNEVSE